MRPLFAVLAALSLSACGPPTPPPPPPPEVKLLLPGTTVIDMALTGTIQVTGCESAKKVVLRDGTRELFQETSSSIDVPFTVTREVLKGRGFGVDLVLKAEATCSDGRSGTSREAGVSFFPVAKLVSLPGDEQVVTDTFIVEGEGEGSSFIGCAGNANGTRSIARVDARGEILNDLPLPFLCSYTMKFTERHPTNATRWGYEPGIGAVAFNLALQGLATFTYGATEMVMLNNGDALTYAPSVERNLARITTAGGTSWTTIVPFPVIAPIRLTGDLAQARLVVREENELGYDTVSVEEYDVANSARIRGWQVYPFPRINATPRAVLSEDTNTLFIAEPTGQGTTNIIACATNLEGCADGARRWQAVPVPGDATHIVPYADEARLLVVTTQGTWSLDTQSGVAQNLRNEPIVPSGALRTLDVVVGEGRAFYILNGPPPVQGLPAPVPVEIVGVDDAAQGETFRLQIASSSIFAGLDESGTLWMRIGSKLAQALPMSDYRQARLP